MAIVKMAQHTEPRSSSSSFDGRSEVGSPTRAPLPEEEVDDPVCAVGVAGAAAAGAAASLPDPYEFEFELTLT